MHLPTATPPDLSSRPFDLHVERTIPLPADVLFRAWTTEFDHWFAAPAHVDTTPEPGRPFFFEVHHAGEKYAHYGRFLEIVPDRRIQFTWLTSGTQGFETMVTVELVPGTEGTLLQLAHAGFPDQESCSQHAQAWPHVLEQLEKAYLATR